MLTRVRFSEFYDQLLPIIYLTDTTLSLYVQSVSTCNIRCNLIMSLNEKFIRNTRCIYIITRFIHFLLSIVFNLRFSIGAKVLIAFILNRLKNISLAET